MITSKKTDGTYGEIGFIKAKQDDGSYKDIEYQYDNKGNLIFEKGFTRSKEGALPLVINGIGKPLKNYDIYGNISQATTPTVDSPQEVVGCGDRTGNLFDKGNTEDIIKSTYINQNGELVTNAAYYMSYPIKVIGGASYTWSFDTDTNAKHTAPTVAFYDSDDSLISVATHSGSIKWFSFSAPENCKYVRGSVYIGQGNNTSMLLNGERSGNANYPLPYEPYGYKVDVVSRGKNLFDFNSATFTRLGSAGTIEVLDNSVRYTLVEGNDNYGVILLNNTKLAAGSYIISCDVIDERTDKTYNSGLRVAINGTWSSTGMTRFTVTETDKVQIAFYAGMPNRGGGYVEVSNIQLELGTEATEYSPYVEPITTPIYLDSPLYKIGDYSDSGGMTEEVRVIKELVLTGEEKWYQSTSATGDAMFFYVLLSNYISTKAEYCTHFTNATVNSATTSVGFMLDTNGQVRFRTDNVSNMTLDDFKSYLTEQYTAGTPVTVYYVLAEPEIKALEPIEIPTLNGTTVIDVDVNMEVKPSNMWVEYKSSTSEYNPITLRTIDNQVLYTADNEILQTRR